jgi:glycogen operon protein
MILDSMRFWVHEMHVDGFRFDLASIFTRDNEGQINLNDPPIISEITADPDFSGIRLIAEAWDLASYQLGRSFPGVTWLQWNARFRDDVRAFVRGDGGVVSSIMTRLYGSDDIFPDQVIHAYHAYQSVNFVTSHDGFCMYDLVSYNAKHNEANGENCTDGANNNLSWNCGWEGDAGLPDGILDLRMRQMKNLCCLLMISNGTPMFVAGDEFMRTQKGNNNPYNQDNETSWMDWSLLEKNRSMFRFFQRMIAFRKTHPSLCRSRFWRHDVSWYGQGAQVDQSELSRSLAFMLLGASQHDVDIYAMINASEGDMTFRIQHGPANRWRRAVDTSLSSPEDITDPGFEPIVESLDYLVRARSVVVLVAK